MNIPSCRGTSTEATCYELQTQNCVAMATLPDQSNNKGRIPPNGKKFNKNAIQMKPYYKDDSSQELYKLLPDKCYNYERKETLTQEKHGTVDMIYKKPVRDVIYPKI